MNLKEIKKIIELVEASKISSLSIEEDNIKIEVKKEAISATHTIPVPVAQAAPALPVAEPEKAAPVEAAPKRDESLVAISSPMVGTYYASSNPESPPYVKVGDRINKGDVVCIVEAMKLFNEIESDISGVVESIEVQNSSPVEYGEELILVRVS